MKSTNISSGFGDNSIEISNRTTKNASPMDRALLRNI